MEETEEYFETGNPTIQLECFTINYEEQSSTAEQWMFFENNGQLQGIDIEHNIAYQLSQYFLVKKIYDFYRFPYKEAHIQ